MGKKPVLDEECIEMVGVLEEDTVMSLSFNKAAPRSTPTRATPTRARLHPSYLPFSWSIVWLSILSTGILARLGGGFHIFLQVEEVASILAPIFTIGMFAAPLEVVMAICKARSVGQHALLPYVTMFGCATLWLRYGLQLEDYTVIVPNAIGFVISAITILCYIFFSSASQRHSALATALLSAGLLSGLVFYGPQSLSSQGLVASGFSVALFAAPLGQFKEVIVNQDSSSLPFMQIVFGALTAFWWSVYGLCIYNPYMFVPNCAGTALSAIQLMLIRMYPKPITKDEGTCKASIQGVVKEKGSDEDEKDKHQG